jgi:hypothetical protein
MVLAAKLVSESRQQTMQQRGRAFTFPDIEDRRSRTVSEQLEEKDEVRLYKLPFTKIVGVQSCTECRPWNVRAQFTPTTIHTSHPSQTGPAAQLPLPS